MVVGYKRGRDTKQRERGKEGFIIAPSHMVICEHELRRGIFLSLSSCFPRTARHDNLFFPDPLPPRSWGEFSARKTKFGDIEKKSFSLTRMKFNSRSPSFSLDIQKAVTDQGPKKNRHWITIFSFPLLLLSF